MSHVAKLKAKFANSSAPSPEQFATKQRQQLQSEAAAIIESRKRAAVYNMTLRALAIKYDSRGTQLKKQDEKARAEAKNRAAKYRHSLRALAHQAMINNDAEKALKAVDHMLSNEAAAVAVAASQIDLQDNEDEGEKAEDMSVIAEETASQSGQMTEEQIAAENERLNREALESFFQEHDVERLGDVEKLLVEFKDNMEVLFEELADSIVTAEPTKTVKKKKGFFGTGKKEDDEVTQLEQHFDNNKRNSVASAVSAQDETTAKTANTLTKHGLAIREVITGFYTAFAPDKIGDVDNVIAHFAGREGDLFKTLEMKYDVKFRADGTAVPNDANRIGANPFIEASSMVQPNKEPKFATDLTGHVLRTRLEAAGVSQDKIQAIVDTSGPMM